MRHLILLTFLFKPAMNFVLFLLDFSIEPTASALESFILLGTGADIASQDQDALKRLFPQSCRGGRPLIRG